jgi:hypothetical protein
MTSKSAGGGGGGGYANLISNLFVIPGQNYSLRAGRGAAGGAFNTAQGNGGVGQNSFFTHNGTTYSGDGGGGGGGGTASGNGNTGGNGGGGGAINFSGSPGFATQGFRGGRGESLSNKEAGGGGGSTQPGNDAGPLDGLGGSGFNLSAWMGTANYRTTVTKFDPRIGTLTLYNTLGVGGGGGGGRDNTPLYYIEGKDGGGYGCFQALENNSGDQFRDGLNRTGGGGGGGARSNGAGNGGSGVVIVRYQGSYRRDTSSGTGVEYRTGTVGGLPYQFVVFGRSNVYNQTLDEIFTPNPNPVFA